MRSSRNLPDDHRAVMHGIMVVITCSREGRKGLNIVDHLHLVALLRQHKPLLVQRYGVTRLALFGSAARDALHKASDIDILIAFDGPATSARYFGVQFFLEDLFNRPVDLVTEKALRPELRSFIEREALYV